MKSDPPAPERWASSGTHYQALERLREGQLTSVWRVRREDGQECALECLRLGRGGDWSDVERFEREGAELQAFAHPAVPRWLETFRTDRDLCIVTEPLEGQAVRALIASGRTLSAAELEGLLAQGLQVLASLHAHSPPIQHRDVSPDHVRVALDPSGPRLILTGFGSARFGPSSGCPPSAASARWRPSRPRVRPSLAPTSMASASPSSRSPPMSCRRTSRTTMAAYGPPPSRACPSVCGPCCARWWSPAWTSA